MDTKAAGASLIIITIAVGMLLISSAYGGTQHQVGGSTGWTNTGTYTSWAASQTFTAGDTLLFTYDSSTHSVTQVPQSGYDGCTTANAINSYNDGNTVIPLTTAGSMYFICPTLGHCAGGMKLAVSVLANSTTTNSTASPPPPPSVSSTTPGSGAPPPPPPKSGAASSSINSLMFGSLFCLVSIMLFV